MKHNLSRRIEELEKALLAKRKDRQAIARSALGGIPHQHLEPLISGYFAARQGRALRADESAAKKAYKEEFTRRLSWCPYSFAEGFEDELDIRQAQVLALAYAVPPPYLELADNAFKALKEGRAVTPEEAEAQEFYIAQFNRLVRVANGEEAPAKSAEEEVHDETRCSLAT